MNAMRRAHEIRAETAAKYSCKPGYVVFSICLKMAWAEDLREAVRYHRL
jgi:hypothetical protein